MELTSQPLSRTSTNQPFAGLLSAVRRQSPMRVAITRAYRRPEQDCLPPLIELASISSDAAARIACVARKLVESLRSKNRGSIVESLVHEYSLSSQEGVALMCLAEALLRIPDQSTRDALIHDKISAGDWKAHLGHSPSLFVNAATWGLMITGRLTATSSENSLSMALTRLIARGGEPLIRRAVDVAIRMIGEQFVTGQTIDEALDKSRAREAMGFRFSYDMLGEAAMTAADAARYFTEYKTAIHAIGQASAGRGIYEGPGISIKLSALHPRYSRAKLRRVMNELVPSVKSLALLAKHYDIGINIDAEEADRLEVSLDVLEALCTDPDLAGWNGIGFVLQAYQKRCPFVVDWLVDLSRRTSRRMMVRLVKGAYWDSEIKRAQVDGLDGFPVFTRKVHTDVSYLACAKKLLAAPDAVFPQFATHNAQTVAAVMAMAGPDFHRGQYEFQCLHGMGEPLYSEIVDPQKYDRPCCIYAPVGTHDTLLAYLVRRLLENGANSSFVNRLADDAITVDELIADPVAAARAISPVGAPHEKIALPRDLYGPERLNSKGVDLTNELQLLSLADAVTQSAEIAWKASPPSAVTAVDLLPVLNPADHRDIVGYVRESSGQDIAGAISAATASAAGWAATGASRRADILRRAADLFEGRMPVLIGLIVREAGKSYANAVSEVREAVDYLRYYSVEAERSLEDGRYAALGPVVCISPWNFPLAIFTGQVAAALACGNPVLAKPASMTPLIAAEAVRILHEAGVPGDVLQFVPGGAKVGEALVKDARVQGVMFTGSTAVARLIQAQLAGRLTRNGHPIPFIAETGGLNALVADSSALTEQVVADVLSSAFDSAGQRCSALRILCLQDDIAERTLAMLKGALRELEIGNPAALSVDVGPIISEGARKDIQSYVEEMRRRGYAVEQAPLPVECTRGTFVAPAIVEVSRIADVEREVFGPVLHVLRFRRESLDRLIGDINASGYGLTFGLHTRIDETITRVLDRVSAGNIYVNRNIIGAVVGVQPFGGSGLSGTGPKAGGPLYMRRLLERQPRLALDVNPAANSAIARSYIAWLQTLGRNSEAERCIRYLSLSALGVQRELAGPVGERNVYVLRARGKVAALAGTEAGLLAQIGAILATGNTAVVARNNPAGATLAGLPGDVAAQVVFADDWAAEPGLRNVLFDGEADMLLDVTRRIAEREGPIVTVQALTEADRRRGDDYDLCLLLEECSISTNTAAAGGNANLMAIG